MSVISGKETKPEIQVRKFLFQRGFRFRKNVKTLPGKPDIVLPKYKTVIFVHGCFWHGHEGCSKASIPSTNIEFWEKKISSNINRDKQVIYKLTQLGWQTFTVWECELKNKSKQNQTLLSIFQVLNSKLLT